MRQTRGREEAATEPAHTTIGALGWFIIAMCCANALLEFSDSAIVDTGKQLLSKTLMLAAVLYGIRRFRPAHAKAWYCLGGFALLTGSIKLEQFGRTLAAGRWEVLAQSPLLFAVTLCASVAIAAASIFILRARRPHGDWPLADAWLIALAILLTCARLVTLPIYQTNGFGLAFLSAGVLTVLRDTLTLVPLLAVVFSEPLRNASLKFYIGGLVLAVLSEKYYFAVHGILVFAGWEKTIATLGIGVGQSCLTVAALLPSMRQVEAPTAESRPPWNALRTVGLLVAVLAPISTEAILMPLERGAVRQAFTAGIGIVVIAIVVRMRAAVASANRSTNELRKLAHHDALTELPNRRYLSSVTVPEFEAKLRAEGRLALTCVYIDVDNLKDINDRMGHQAGDRLICEIASALRGLSYSLPYTALRLGGDEFLIVAEGDSSEVAWPETPLEIELLHAIRSTPVAQDATYASASIGVVSCSFSSAASSLDSDVNHMIDKADLAQVRAKRQGGCRVVRYEPCMSASARHAARVNRDISSAWGRNEMSLVYQPVVHLDDGSLYGAEALLRWKHPELGFVPPPEAILAAERQGIVTELGLRILDRAFEEIAKLPSHQRVRVGVNLSSHQLRRSNVEKIIEHVASSGLGEYLWLEITEQELVESRQFAAHALNELRGSGVLVAIDDFGTGFCGLDYLCTLPVDLVKLDGVFAQGSANSAERRHVTELGVKLAASIGALTLAEGVEDMETASRMHRLGCTFGQGYAFARPLPSLAQAIECVHRLA